MEKWKFFYQDKIFIYRPLPALGPREGEGWEREKKKTPEKEPCSSCET